MKESHMRLGVRFTCLLVLCFSLSGCVLFSLPGQIIGGIFGLLGQALNVAGSLPKPPPWMFF